MTLNHYGWRYPANFLKYVRQQRGYKKMSEIMKPQKMPLELKERLTEWATALNLVYGFFKDKDKTILWFSIPNPLLGDMTPRDMIRVGRFKKLLNFIQTALEENK